MKGIKTVLFCLTLIGLSLTIFSQSTEWNLDFEEWELQDTTPGLWHDTTVIENRTGLFPPKWHFRPDHIPEGKGLGRTTDATEGNYAVTLSGYYSYEVMRIISGESADRSGWPIDFKPDNLTGDYKSILLGSCDSLRTYVEVYLTNYNTLNNRRDTIGEATATLSEASSYEQFKLQIEYSNETIIPDTVIIVLAEERFGFDVPPACLECSHVFFDNLKLITTVSTKNLLLKNKVEIFPNPSRQNVFLKTECAECRYNIDLFCTRGQNLKRYEWVNDMTEIITCHLEKGVYILRIEEAISGNYIYQKIIVE